MSEIGDGFDQRARAAAAGLRRAVELHPPDLGDLVTVSRVRRVGRAALTVAILAVLGSVAFAIAAVGDPLAVRWGTAAILLVLLAATWLLCAHAGGHAWFVPLPAFALAAAWAFTVSARSPVAAWWLVALSALASGGGVVIAGTALRQRVQGSPIDLRPTGGATGVAVTDLAPCGVVRVGGETWSAESVSGPLPVGAPVHVLRVQGVRLEVWSEVGTVPDANVLDTEEDQP
jgi:membrane protein implicated in regulation of membrane protease activity